MAKKGNWICSFCGKDCGNPPALEMHMRYCKRKNGENVEKKVSCEHEFRLLNPQSKPELGALQDGYLKVCTKCSELE